MELNDFFKKINSNVNEDNKNDFLKSLQSNVVDKKESLNHFNELIGNNSSNNYKEKK